MDIAIIVIMYTRNITVINYVIALSDIFFHYYCCYVQSKRDFWAFPFLSAISKTSNIAIVITIPITNIILLINFIL